jgi:FG-GAP-like repeat
MKQTGWLVILFSFVFATIIMGGCNNYKRNQTHPEIDNADIGKGKALAAVYCQSCHSLPDPSQLNARSWEKGVLPNMAPRLGIFSYLLQRYPSSRYDRFLDKNFYPSAPLLKPEEWKNIMDYYIATSPDSLPPQQRTVQIQNGLPLFKAVIPALHYPDPTTCYISIDSLAGAHRVLLGDAIRKNILCLNSQLQVVDSVAGSGSVVNLDIHQHEMLACDIGMLNPNNLKLGKAEHISLDKNGKMKMDSIPVFSSLARPVQITSADLNNDGKADYLICEFGNLTGTLSWMENLGNNQYQHRVITATPGAIKAYIRDENHDGLPDLWVLFAQGDERISLFTNLGNGNFSERKVLRFPPSYGSSYFELADFNHDGSPDIVYTCGDNADYSEVLKPYHGVYIFLNDGKNNFTQKYFFPINGCYKAMARDFDGDGDLDLAVISFFADYARQPEEGFVYLENKGDYNFKPYTLPEGKLGRWLTMDAADLDGDGKTDIILGNFSIAPSFIKSKQIWTQGPPFLFLKNIGK